MQSYDAFLDEIQPGHCYISRRDESDPHLKEECDYPQTWEPEYDGPVDDEYGTAYHRAWESAHPRIDR